MCKANKKRNIGIDLLRMLSIYFIVILHILGHGGIIDHVERNTIAYAAIWLLEIIAYGAVNCFALISGYVSLYSKCNISNYLELWLRVFFYSVIIGLIVFLCYRQAISTSEFASCFFPVMTSKYWYFTAFSLLYIFEPILNRGIQNLEKTRCQIALVVLFAMVFISHFFSIIFKDVFFLKEGYSPLWLIILYILGAYIRKYGFFKRIKTCVFLFLFFSFSFITLGSKYLIQLITSMIFGKVILDSVFIGYTSVTIVAGSVFLFCFFERLEPSISIERIIRIISPTVFSVYLIQDNFLIRKIFISDNFVWVFKFNTVTMIFVILIIALSIYIICTAIDFIREQIFNLLKIKQKLNYFEDKMTLDL